VGYSDYGGRGVRVCEAWLNSFQSFLDDAGEYPGLGYMLKLKDGNGHFEPGNVQWAEFVRTPGRNKRSNHSLDDEHLRQCLEQMAEDSGLDPETLACRFIRALTDGEFASI